ncbi:MAG: phenylacetate--CoA ligase family protein, partial [Haliea sp.]
MTQNYDVLETRASQEREAALMVALPAQVMAAQQGSRAFGEILKDVDARLVDSRAALAKLPVTRKTDLLARQQASRAAGQDVFGGFSALAFGERMPHVFASPGPIYEPGGTRADYWRLARAFHAAG